MNDQDNHHTEMEDASQQDFGEDRPLDEEQIGLSEEEASSSKATILVKKDEETILDFTIDDLPVEIGRKSENHIVLDEKNVSRIWAAQAEPS